MEQATIRAGQLLADALRHTRHSSDSDIERLAAIWRVAVGDDSEELLDIVDDGIGQPHVIRYDIVQAFYGAVSLITGPAAGPLAGLAVMAGLLALKRSRSELPVGSGIIVSALAGAPSREMSTTAVEGEFTRRIATLTGHPPIASDFSTALAILENEEVVRRTGNDVHLCDVVFLNAIVL